MCFRHILLGLALALPVVVFAAAPDLERLNRAGNYADAYRLGQERLDEGLGEPDFDFQFGLAAVHAGFAHEAVLAFERVLMARPSDHRARLELARALFVVGDYERSERHFERVLATEPPALVAGRIQGFLDAIERRQKAVGRGISGGIFLGLGHDSNINSATAADQVLVFGLPISLAADSREMDSWFSELDATVNLRQPLSKTRGLFGQLAYRHRTNFETSDFNLDVVGLAAGYGVSSGPSQWRFPVQLQLLYLDHDLLRTLGSAGVEWTRALGASQELTLFSQVALTDFPDARERDARLLLAGGAWTKRFADSGGALTLTGFGGAESAREDYNGRRLFAARAVYRQPLGADHSVSVSALYQRASYRDEAPLFAERRRDDFFELAAGWTWRLTRSWALRSQLSWIDNQSSIEFYEYDRTQAQLALGYLFE